MKFTLTLLVFICLVMAGSKVNAQSATASVTVTGDSARLKSYVGSYTFGSGSPVQKFTVTVENGTLFGEADSFGKNKLIKQAKENTYQSTSSYGSMITFVWDTTTKAVTGLTLSAQGTELTAKKDNP